MNDGQQHRLFFGRVMDGVFFCRCSDFEKRGSYFVFCATKIGNPRSYRPYIVVCTSKLILVVKGLTEAILSPGNVWPKHEGLQVFLGVPRRAYDTGSSFWLKRFLNDGAAYPKIVGISILR